MESIIHLITFEDDSTKVQLKAVLSSLAANVKTYSNEQAFLKYYFSSIKGAHKECIIINTKNSAAPSIALIKELNKLKNIIPVIIISGDSSIESCRNAFKSGAFEYLTRPLNVNELLNIVSESFLHYESEVEEFRTYISLKDKFSKLSNREKEVMEMILEGNTSKEAAEKLSLSPRTVEVHRSNMYTKLKIRSLPQLVQEYDFFKKYDLRAS
ncbi:MULTISPECIES: response regulator transcription factor [Enterobacterales]|uniref:response regulator transcription factor n=1 Tax=Enterobacterales TaxID=91347 RepID=UPI000847FEC7|nr:MULTISPECIES: LuxR C-terminal-related transcriptional regulator [Enterobacterales]WOO49023.1 LuxR C-terminal-related transcriptional regulator [Hafnia alvei]MCK9781145.1 LuxR C-terminal-related transcriptional regulator [Proteus columbae]MCT6518017.1 LuxR C-terminal-related transcriptional regulator [Proteus vulgaris]ODQ07795.1 DNA-binding response regulator [Shigella sp. FC130]OEI95302.1 DNA-binding response regulator [Shigella sp. FC1655]